MTNKEIKTEIQKSLDNVPENVLHDVFNFLKQAEKQTAESIRLIQNLRIILTEDMKLLDQLAK